MVMVRMDVRVEDWEHAALKQYAEAREILLADVMRRILRNSKEWQRAMAEYIKGD